MLTIKGTQTVIDTVPHEGGVVHSEATHYLELVDVAGNEYLLSTRESTVVAIKELLEEIQGNLKSIKA